MTRWEVLRHVVSGVPENIPLSWIIIVMPKPAVYRRYRRTSLRGQFHQSRNFRAFEVYLIVAITYLLLAIMGRRCCAGDIDSSRRTMPAFTVEIILSHLLAATRWTIVLSLIAFLNGGVVRLLFCRASRVNRSSFAKDTSSSSGHSAADGCSCSSSGLLCSGSRSALSCGLACVDVLDQRISDHLARLRRGAAARSMGARPRALYIEQMRYVILPPAAYRHPPTVGFSVRSSRQRRAAIIGSSS
jgi:hypothetical protein